MSNTWDHQVTLLGVGEITTDELGQQISNPKETVVFCCRKPTPRSEYYSAKQAGIRVAELLVVHPYEYNQETEVRFNGTVLHIERVYQISLDELELTCVERLGD
ncbi:MAG: phage head closure protein [Lachnospiraceae bacterium]